MTEGFAAIVLFIIFARIMLLEILKAWMVGFIVALPIGPIFLMVVQGTLCYSRRVGRMIGFGSAAGDMVYACVGLLTLELIKSFVLEHQGLFMVVGGVIVGAIGIGMYYREVSVDLPASERQLSDWSCVLQGFTGALSNPGALAAMLALLTAFRLGAGSFRAPLWVLTLAVGAGEAVYWTLVTRLLSRYVRVGNRTLRFGSKVAGSLVFIFALVLLVRGGLMIIRN